MFDNLKRKPVTGTVAQSAASPVAEDAARSEATQKPSTVIAAETQFTGNISTRCDVQVRGLVLGNIVVETGCVRVMRSGKIEGDITAPQILLDGEVRGRCIAESVEILEHGRLDGIVQSGRFSIRTGGYFVGQAEDVPAAYAAGVVADVLQEPEDVDVSCSADPVASGSAD